MSRASDVNQMRFLVTWIDKDGNPRGQTTKTKPDAVRMYEWICGGDARYAEIRKLGPIERSWENDECLSSEQVQ